MGNHRTVWTDSEGDLRKKDDPKQTDATVDKNQLDLKLRRLTAGKGRTIIEITDLPKNKLWCQKLAKELKKVLGVGGTYKNNFIELHGENIEKIKQHLTSKGIKFKQTGG